MEDYILINSVERVDHLRSLVRQDLRDANIKLPKSKKLKKLNQSRSVSRDDLRSTVFGEHLCNLPAEFVKEHGYVPRFLIEAAKVINRQLGCEGIFRKSGSVCRQKELRQAVNQGKSLDDANIYDVAVLVKQFFRDLPEPVFTSLYHDAFMKCYQLPPEKDPGQALLQLCLCLPLENIGALRFTLHLLDNVASNSGKNKMNASNLALVLAPNFMHSNKGLQKMSSSEEKHLHIEASVVEILIKNCKFVGLVNSTLQKQVGLMTECFATDDELDVSDDNTLEDSKSIVPKKKRRRSGSLTGIVNSIASGFAKLRRSTDGRNMNVSSNSTFPGELSIASNSSVAPDHNLDYSAATPCVMRKRRASGDNVPFSASKKKAILGNLPQMSALASTPFTPSSTVKRNGDGRYINESVHLNSTTPCQGAKASRKKLNLFTSPGSNKKVKRQSSLAKLTSSNPRDSKGKGRNFFRRLSGSRNEKEEDNSLCSSKDRRGRPGSADSTSPRSTISDSAITDFPGSSIIRSASSPSIHETDVFSESCNGSVSSEISKNSAFDDFERIRKRPPRPIDKSEISSPQPVIVPVLNNAKDLGRSTPMRRSRKDEFELASQAKRRGKFSAPAHVTALDKSVCSQLDVSLMEAVLAPPSGFGDQTMLEEPINVDDTSDQDPLSVLSGVSGKVKNLDTSTSQGSSGPNSSPSSVETIVNARSLAVEKRSQHHGNMSMLSWSEGGLGKLSEETFIDVGGVEDLYVALRPPKPQVQEGDYVVLRKNYSVAEEGSQRSNQGGIDMLRESYRSEEDSSSSVNESCSSHVESDLEELKNIPSKPNIHKKKSLSAQDLKSTIKVSLPTRSQSQYISPRKKMNYIPHLEISKETHRILTNAGYLKVDDSAVTTKDSEVPVKSPKRSAFREEMIQSLRYSFHERHNITNRSVLSRSNVSNISMDSFNSSVNSLGQSSLCDSRTPVDRTTKSSDVGALKEKDSEKVSSSDVSSANVKTEQLRTETVQAQEDGEIVGNVSNDILEGEEKKSSSDPQVEIESTLDKASGDHCQPNVMKTDFKFTLPPKASSIKDSDRSLTLSGFLDQEIKRDGPPIKIKRAEIKLPTHDSVSNLKVFQAGLVAENVKQFSQSQMKKLAQAKKLTFPDAKKRGNSPVRIPTIFAKRDDSFKHYQEIAQFVRERTGNISTSQSMSEDMNMRPSPSHSVTKLDSNTGDVWSGSNSSVLEANQSKEICKQIEEGKGSVEPLVVLESSNNSTIDSGNSSAGTGLNSSVSQIDKTASDKELVKSPLQESTNTAPTSVVPTSAIPDSVKLYTPLGLTPKRLLLKNDASLHHRSNPRPQLKRLKGQRSPRRMRAHKSPNRHALSGDSSIEGVVPSSDHKLSSVVISFEDQELETSNN